MVVTVPEKIYGMSLGPSQKSRVLSDLRKQARYTQTQMAGYLGLTRDRYKNYEYNTEPPEDVLQKARGLVESLRPVAAAPSARLRVLGAMGAGPAPASEPDEDSIYVPLDFAREDYQASVLEADALSMWPYLQPGDTLIFKATKTPRAGKIVAVRLADEQSPVVKKMEVQDGRLVLRSLNPKFPNAEVDGTVMLGILVGFISADMRVKIGPEEAGIDERYLENQFRARLPE